MFKNTFAIELLALTLTLCFGAASQANASQEGKGGVAYVCRLADGPHANQIYKARLLDLWEPEALTFSPSSATLSDQLEAVAKKLENFDPFVGSDFRYYLEKIRGQIVKTQKPIPLSEDAFPQYVAQAGASSLINGMKVNCGFEQVALYGWINELQTDGLRIYSEIYDSPAFSDTDRAALLTHEAVYLGDREMNGAQNSLRTRAIVAAEFADQRPSLILKRLIVGWASQGKATGTSFENLEIDFSQLLTFKFIGQGDELGAGILRRGKIGCHFIVKYQDEVIHREDFTVLDGSVLTGGATTKVVSFTLQPGVISQPGLLSTTGECSNGPRSKYVNGHAAAELIVGSRSMPVILSGTFHLYDLKDR